MPDGYDTVWLSNDPLSSQIPIFFKNLFTLAYMRLSAPFQIGLGRGVGRGKTNLVE